MNQKKYKYQTFNTPINEESEETREDEAMTVVAGLQVTISQEPFMRADAVRARKVLDHLQSYSSQRCYTSPSVKEVEVDS